MTKHYWYNADIAVTQCKETLVNLKFVTEGVACEGRIHRVEFDSHDINTLALHFLARVTFLTLFHIVT